MNIEQELAKVGLDRDTFESCLSDISDKLNGINDLDWEEIRDKYSLPIQPDCLRKANSRPFGGIFVKEYFSQKNTTLPSYNEQMAEIRKEKQKLYDARAALNKINRENGRLEQDLNYLAGLIRDTAYKPLTLPVHESQCGDNDLLIAVSDVHMGLDVNNTFGEYSSCIALKRMGQYLSEVFKIQSVHNSKDAYVFLGGDLISGDIHPTVQLENRENVVLQIQKVSEMISDFAYKLAERFENVYVNGVAGNHSRLNPKKEQSLRDERLDDLVLWYMKAKLYNMENIHFVDYANYDATIAKFDIRGHEYLLVHGDYDRFSESGVGRLVMMLGHKPSGILCGHMHRCSMDDISGVKILRSGCFSGAIDDYVVSKRISGKPSQLVCVMDGDGVRALYPVELN